MWPRSFASFRNSSQATREFPIALGEFPNSIAAWERRLQSGKAGSAMINSI